MPVYRYKCESCGLITEEIRSLKEGARGDHTCGRKLNIPAIPNTSPEAWLDKPTAPPVLDSKTVICSGTVTRIYDSFQFHISGR